MPCQKNNEKPLQDYNYQLKAFHTTQHSKDYTDDTFEGHIDADRIRENQLHKTPPHLIQGIHISLDN
jgi:hypothetical protein